MQTGQLKALYVLKGLIYWALIMLTILIASALAGCASKSGQLVNQTKQEKVVIINYQSQNKNSLNYFKVRRIERGVVDYIYSTDYYLPGDTVYASFR